MTWPERPLPLSVRAILLLPAGMRAFDEDLLVDFPAPRFIEFSGDERGRYELMAISYSGLCDGETRALYVLGGRYLPHGGGALRLAADEVHDQ